RLKLRHRHISRNRESGGSISTNSLCRLRSPSAHVISTDSQRSRKGTYRSGSPIRVIKCSQFSKGVYETLSNSYLDLIEKEQILSQKLRKPSTASAYAIGRHAWPATAGPNARPEAAVIVNPSGYVNRTEPASA